MKHVGAAEAKAHFSELIAEVAHSGAPVVIERHGRPLVALVALADLKRVERPARSRPPRGALAFIGAWSEMGEEAIDEFIADVYRQREADIPRPVELPE